MRSLGEWRPTKANRHTVVFAGILLGLFLGCKRKPPTNPLVAPAPLPTSTPTFSGGAGSPSPSLSPSPSPGPSGTPTVSATATDTATYPGSITDSPTPSPSLTESATLTESPTSTPSPTASPTLTQSASRTATRSVTPTFTRTPVSFSAHVQPIFNSQCTSCHGINGGLTLSSGSSYGELADVPAESSCVGQPRVDRANSDPDNSVVVKKVSGTTCGSKMGALSAGQIQVIRDWISQGALNN